jgi:hypothetical protein
VKIATTTGNNSAWHLSPNRIPTRRAIERSERMSRDGFPDRGSRPRTASTGAVREGSGKSFEQFELGRSLPPEGIKPPAFALRASARQASRFGEAGSALRASARQAPPPSNELTAGPAPGTIATRSHWRSRKEAA